MGRGSRLVTLVLRALGQIPYPRARPPLACCRPGGGLSNRKQRSPGGGMRGVAYPAAHARPPRSRGPAAGTGGAAAAAPVRQTGTAAVLVHAGLPACPGAGPAPCRRPHGVQRRVPPAPAHLVCERRPDGDGQRGRVRRARGERARRPGGGAGRPRRGAARGARRAPGGRGRARLPGGPAGGQRVGDRGAPRGPRRAAGGRRRLPRRRPRRGDPHVQDRARGPSTRGRPCSTCEWSTRRP